jgi:hypothetical protein
MVTTQEDKEFELRGIRRDLSFSVSIFLLVSSLARATI